MDYRVHRLRSLQRYVEKIVSIEEPYLIEDFRDFTLVVAQLVKWPPLYHYADKAWMRLVVMKFWDTNDNNYS